MEQQADTQALIARAERFLERHSGAPASTVRLIRDLVATLSSQEADCEEEVIAHVDAHWFTQGGRAEFGDLGTPRNADEVIAAILRVVRAAQEAHDQQAFAAGWQAAVNATDREGETFGLVADAYAAYQSSPLLRRTHAKTRLACEGCGQPAPGARWPDTWTGFGTSALRTQAVAHWCPSCKANGTMRREASTTYATARASAEQRGLLSRITGQSITPPVIASPRPVEEEPTT